MVAVKTPHRWKRPRGHRGGGKHRYHKKSQEQAAAATLGLQLGTPFGQLQHKEATDSSAHYQRWTYEETRKMIAAAAASQTRAAVSCTTHAGSAGDSRRIDLLSFVKRAQNMEDPVRSLFTRCQRQSLEDSQPAAFSELMASLQLSPLAVGLQLHDSHCQDYCVYTSSQGELQRLLTGRDRQLHIDYHEGKGSVVAGLWLSEQQQEQLTPYRQLLYLTLYAHMLKAWVRELSARRLFVEYLYVVRHSEGQLLLSVYQYRPALLFRHIMPQLQPAIQFCELLYEQRRDINDSLFVLDTVHGASQLGV